MNNQIKLGRIGYAWCFPLSDKEYHIGCGSLDSDPRKILKELGWMRHVSKKDVRCYCSGKIRLTAPQYSQPFVTLDQSHRVWGVGEAIGCVAPLAGDGIVPGMRSVQIFLEHWENPSGYTKAILREFKWMTNERRVIDKLRGNGGLSVGDAWVLRKNSRRMGMEVGLKDAILLLHHLI
jgi:flavin-dependent dehydrogenase